MKIKHLMLSGVLLIPAMLLPLASCDDSNAPTSPAVDQPTAGNDGPSLATQRTGARVHDARSEAGQKIRCFSGGQDTRDDPQIEGGPFFGECYRFKTRDGAELVTFDADANPNNNYAGVYPADNRIKGKRIGSVRELDFSYAGGPPSGGAPRFSIPIDEDANGTTEAYAFTDANGCNDGDGFVGTIEADDDPTCLISYKAETFANWKAFVTAHPTYRIARAITFVIVDQPAHYILWKVDIR